MFARLFLRGYSLAVIGFPFALGSPGSAVERARRHTFAERFRERSPFVRLSLWCFCAAAWPFGALLEALRHGASLDGGWRERWRVYCWALLHNVPPVEYVTYRLDRPDARALWSEYLYWFDVPVLKRLNRLRGANNEDVQNKLRFAALCKAHGAPTVPAFPAAGSAVKGLAAEDLWLKPVDRNGAAGAECWTFQDGHYVNAGRQLQGEQLLAHAETRKLLIQPRLRNHAEMERLTNGALAALRLVTAHHRDGRVSLLANSLVVPQGSCVTSAGGAVAAVDWDSGTIRQVILNSDPKLEQKAQGTVVPFWKECLALVCRTHHEAFPLFATLGWDVALTPAGPVLLETNSGWGAVALQELWGPLGKTAFSTLLDEEFAQEDRR